MYGVFFFLLFLAYSPALQSQFSLPKSIVLCAGVLALSTLLLVRNWRGSHLVAPSGPSLLLALALGGWWVLSTPFALHLPTALNGEYGRYHGLWTHLCCLALFVASVSIPSDTTTVRRIAAVLIAAIATVAAINISESAGLSALRLKAASTLGDRVAAGALMNFAIPFAAVALVRARHWRAKAGAGALLALLLVSEFLSQSRGPWLGLVVAVIILVIGLIRSNARWTVVAVVLTGMVALAGLAAKLNPLVGQRLATFTHLAQDEAISQRLIYFRAALRAIADHPIAGIGFENFRNSYPRYRGGDDVIYFFNNDIIPTMVHNGYLEAALNSGIPALILYLALVAVVLIKIGRQLSNHQDSDRRDLLLCFMAALGAYLVQDLSGWRNMGLAPAFWVMLGLATNLADQPTARTVLPTTRLLVNSYSASMVLLSLYLLASGYARVTADARLFEAKYMDVVTQWRATESLVKQVLASLAVDSHVELAAAHIYARRFVLAGDSAAYTRSHELLESSYGHNRFNRLLLFDAINLETVALEHGQIEAPSAFVGKALSVLAETDLENPAFHDYRAKFLAAQGRYADALAAIREAMRLAPHEERFRSSEAHYLTFVR